MQLELAGFTSVIRENLRLEVGQSAMLSFTMQLATVQETVTVTGEAPLVDSQKSELAGRITAGQVQDLPLNGRNWLDLVALVPGARGNPGTVRAGFAGGDMAKYQVDGVDVSGTCCGGSNQGYSQENIQEFEVITNRYDAEYGRAAGVVINAVTKSGTNQFRGSAFTFIRDSDLGDAPNFFTNTVQPFRKSRAASTAAGRSSGIARFSSPATSTRTAPSPRFPRPALRRWTCRRATTSRVTTPPAASTWSWGRAHRVFVRSSKYDWEQINVGVGERNALSNGYSRPSKNTDLSAGQTWVITNKMVHEIRAGFSAIDNQLVSNSALPLHTFPSIIIGSPTNSPQWWTEFNLQVNNSLSYFIPSWHGQHTLKTGVQFFQPDYDGAFPSAEPWGASYTFSTDPRDPNDPSTYPAPTRYSVVLGDPSYHILNNTYGAFFKDDWVVSPKLTLNLGFRYDIELGTVNTDLQSPIEPGEKRGDYNNIAPRLGFAYDLRGDGRTVLRGGWGRNFDKVLLNISSNERRSLLFQFASQTVLNPSYTNPLGGITFERHQEPEPAAQHRHDRQRLQDADAGSGVGRHRPADRLAGVGADGLHPHRGLQRAARQEHQLLRGSGDASAAPSDPERPSVSARTTRSRAMKRPRRRSTTASNSASRAAASAPSGRGRKCRAATRCRGPTAITRAIASTA